MPKCVIFYFDNTINRCNDNQKRYLAIAYLYLDSVMDSRVQT